MLMPDWKSPRRVPDNVPVLAKIRWRNSTYSAIVMVINDRCIELAAPHKRVRLLAWHCRVPSLDSRKISKVRSLNG